jgi:flagella basal body P-ring formation protein FlgA
MRRTILAVILALATPAAAAAQVAEPGAEVTGSLGPTAPVLKRSVTVSGDVVRIGDLIDNAGAAASIAIFRAPDFGTTGSVSAAQVVQAARAHAVIGIDTSGASDVLVTRAGRAVTTKDVEARVAQTVARRLGLPGDSDITARLDRDLQTFYVEAGAAAPVQISRLRYDQRSGHFDAIMEVPGSAMTRPLRLSGTAFETVEVATLARALARGDVVRASDVVMERRPKSEVNGDIAETADRIVGMALRRAARAGQLLRMTDLMRPELVQRNDTVMAIFEAPGIMLTSRAKALESGAEGDLISVVNLQSKRTVQATVTGPGTVTVTTFKPRVAAATPDTSAVPQDSRTE